MTSVPTPSPLVRLTRHATLWSGLSLAIAHVVASSGGPAWPRLVALIALGLCACVSAFGRGWPWLDRFRLPLVLLLLSQVPQVTPTLHRPDGFEYYVVARSLLFDRDLELANDYACLKSFGQFQDGRSVTRTPSGLAILWAPAVVSVHVGTLAARGLGATVPADGCSAPYQAGVTLASFLFGAMAVFLTEGVVRRRYGPAIALLVAFALCFSDK